jgi:hypothetical protein
MEKLSPAEEEYNGGTGGGKRKEWSVNVITLNHANLCLLYHQLPRTKYRKTINIHTPLLS